MKKTRLNPLGLISIFLLAACSGCDNSQPDENLRNAEEDRIKPLTENPWYWQYKGNPVWLIGGSWQDNLFNHPTGLEEHLDLLASVGGNYARNVMSHRNAGNVFAYEQNDGGQFDLDRFNDEYWQRFDRFLELTYNRDIIVQIEIWDPWDLHEDHQTQGGWSHHPFNPKNNITWTPEESALPTEADYPPQSQPTEHPFWYSVPKLHDNELLLKYQKSYVDKLLSYSLNYPHLLYCINNETGEPNEWGDFWADYVRNKADEAGVTVETTNMRRNENIRSSDHAHIFNNPELYTFLDISQNNAWSGIGLPHYENILYVRAKISENPRPINNNKNYGAARGGEEESVARMGRNLFGGAASSRFHRPHPYEDPAYVEAQSDFGLGLSPRARMVIQSISKVTESLAFERAEPRPDLLKSDDEAYLLSEPGSQYAVYFPYGGKAEIEMEPSGSDFRYRWINLDQGAWSESGTLIASDETVISAPSSGHWIIFIKQEM